MIVGGLQRSSLIDYPEKISAIIFTQGCNFRCPYCYNPELVDPDQYTEPIAEDVIFKFLGKRQGKLDGVVITGGEPTIQPDLFNFVRKIKEMGFLVKLDTNGSRPDIIKKGIKSDLFDYLALDVKAPLKRYKIVTNSDVKIDKIKESIQAIMNSDLDYEFRTTVVKGLLTLDDLFEIGKMIKGARVWALQNFEPKKILDTKTFDGAPFTEDEIEILRDRLAGFVKTLLVRN